MQDESYKELPGDHVNVETESGDVIVNPDLAEFDPTLIEGEYYPETVVDVPLPEDTPEASDIAVETEKPAVDADALLYQAKVAAYRADYDRLYASLETNPRLDAVQIRELIEKELGKDPSESQ